MNILNRRIWYLVGAFSFDTIPRSFPSQTIPILYRAQDHSWWLDTNGHRYPTYREINCRIECFCASNLRLINYQFLSIHGSNVFSFFQFPGFFLISRSQIITQKKTQSFWQFHIEDRSTEDRLKSLKIDKG